VEQRAYNLRPRKDDSDTIQRRSKFARLRRQQQNQRRNKRKEAETLRQEEIKSAYEQYARNNLWKKLPERDNDSEVISKRSTLFFFSSPIILILNTVTDYALSFTPCS
jgi:hypothetical protein